MISKQLRENIQSYIDTHYVELPPQTAPLCASYSKVDDTAPKHAELKKVKAALPMEKRKLEDLVFTPSETFSEMLLRLIDEKSMTDVEAYKKACISRKLFSKIRSNKEYNPSKSTCLSFAIALNLNLDETLDLLGKAGYTLSNCSKFDLIIKFFIEESNYDLFEINQVLDEFEQPLLTM